MGHPSPVNARPLQPRESTDRLLSLARQVRGGTRVRQNVGGASDRQAAPHLPSDPRRGHEPAAQCCESSPEGAKIPTAQGFRCQRHYRRHRAGQEGAPAPRGNLALSERLWPHVSYPSSLQQRRRAEGQRAGVSTALPERVPVPRQPTPASLPLPLIVSNPGLHPSGVGSGPSSPFPR